MQLRAGQFSITYDNGFLRHISVGNTMVLQMICFAVRDTAWNTMDSEIVEEEITADDRSFHISYRRLFHTGNIRMQWQVQIHGDASSTIHFDIQGSALDDFQTNRVGICVLHPIKECAGQKALLTHTDGATEESVFPVDISPHQPFKDLAALQWETSEGLCATLRFDGDIFETEDQRNWTDNSYKTYSTPLDLPFPRWVRKGEQIIQRVECSLKNVDTPIPAIGIGRSVIRNIHYKAGLTRLSEIGFSHYRIDLDLDDTGWSKTLDEALEEGQCLNAPLEIALFIEEEDRRLEQFLRSAPDGAHIRRFLLLEKNKPCIGNRLLEKVVPLLRQGFPGVLIGGGTNHHFAELNRSDISTTNLDFVGFPIQPQVHASDDISLMENAAAQGYAVTTAKHKYGIPIHLSPVTIIARHLVDKRQQTEFAASWTASSLQQLTQAGASSITYFESLGAKGIARYDEEFIPFPVMRVFEEFLSR